MVTSTKSRTVQIVLPAKVAQQLKAIAEELGQTESAMGRQLLMEQLRSRTLDKKLTTP